MNNPAPLDLDLDEYLDWRPSTRPASLLIVGAPATEEQTLDYLRSWGAEGATVWPVKGLWKGAVEDSVAVLVTLSPQEVHGLALGLQDRFRQESVFILRLGDWSLT